MRFRNHKCSGSMYLNETTKAEIDSIIIWLGYSQIKISINVHTALSLSTVGDTAPVLYFCFQSNVRNASVVLASSTSPERDCQFMSQKCSFLLRTSSSRLISTAFLRSSSLHQHLHQHTSSSILVSVYHFTINYIRFHILSNPTTFSTTRTPIPRLGSQCLTSAPSISRICPST